jgi:hypothetical protein
MQDFEKWESKKKDRIDTLSKVIDNPDVREGEKYKIEFCLNPILDL